MMYISRKSTTGSAPSSTSSNYWLVSQSVAAI